MSAQLSLQALRALCDEAALPFDPDNPPGVKGAPPETLNPERHLAACEALAAEAPQNRRLQAILARHDDLLGRRPEAMAAARRGAEPPP